MRCRLKNGAPATVLRRAGHAPPSANRCKPHVRPSTREGLPQSSAQSSHLVRVQSLVPAPGCCTRNALPATTCGHALPSSPFKKKLPRNGRHEMKSSVRGGPGGWAHRSGGRARPCDLCVDTWRVSAPREHCRAASIAFCGACACVRVGATGDQECRREGPFAWRPGGDRGRYHRHTTAKQGPTAAGSTRQAAPAEEEQRSPLARNRATRRPVKTRQRCTSSP